MPITSVNMPLPQVAGINQRPRESRVKNDARKNAPKPKSRGKSAPQKKRKYVKKSEYWKKPRGKRNKK
jgi:hypothetical protein